jgi:hypothetical protein
MSDNIVGAYVARRAEESPATGAPRGARQQSAAFDADLPTLADLADWDAPNRPPQPHRRARAETVDASELGKRPVPAGGEEFAPTLADLADWDAPIVPSNRTVAPGPRHSPRVAVSPSLIVGNEDEPMSSEASKPATTDDLRPLRADAAPRLEVVKHSDELDLDALRIDASQVEGVAAKVPLTIQVRKPPKQEWIRVHPEPSYRLTVGAIDLKEEGEFYVAGAGMREQLVGSEAAVYTLYTYINRVGVLRLWPIRQADPDGKQNEWHRTAEKAAEFAMRGWVRVVSNRSLGAYEIMQATVHVPDPVWPDLSMGEIVRVALKDRGLIVDHPDHPVLRKLQGRL